MWYNGIIKWLLRSPLHSFISGNIALISYNGRTTHKLHSVPVSYVRFYDQEGEEKSGRLAVLSFRKRNWWRNLRDGRPFTLRLRGRDIPATAEVIEDDRRVQKGLGHLLAVAPHYAEYMVVTLDEDGRPNPDELAQAAAKRVIIYLLLKTTTE